MTIHAQYIKSAHLQTLQKIIASTESGTLSLVAVMQEMFLQRGVSPTTTRRYLKELEMLNLIKVDEEQGIIAVLQ